MILIWDNGEEYSDHAVCFFDCTGWAAEDADALEDMLRWEGKNSRVIAVTKSVSWREPEAVTPGGKALTWWDVHKAEWRPKHIGALRRCAAGIKADVEERRARHQSMIDKWLEIGADPVDAEQKRFAEKTVRCERASIKKLDDFLGKLAQALSEQ